MKRASTFLCLWSILLGVVAASGQETGLARHRRMFAVPAPVRVTIDGKLDDWDLSGAIEMYVMRATREMQSARFAVMYDREAIYLGAEVTDPTPLRNRHAPEAEGDKAWDADSCQFRIITDASVGYPANFGSFQESDPGNGRLAQAILWCFTDRQEPNLQLETGMQGQLPPASMRFGVIQRERFRAAYRPSEDHRGYTFEYRIPWEVLGFKSPPKSGDQLAATVQFNWSRPDGLKTAGGAAWCYDLMSGPGFPYQSSACWGKLIFSAEGKLAKELVEEGLPPERPTPLGFQYDLPEDGQATIALFNAKSEVVRALVAAGDRRAGRQTERWDGLDSAGKPLPPGAYAWKGLYHQPLVLRHVLSVHNSGQPPWKTDDGTGGWGGNHGVPTAVCTSADRVYLLWNVAEAGFGLIATDLAGKKLWGSSHDGTYMATDGKHLFLAGGYGFDRSPTIKVLAIEDGRVVALGNGASKLAAPPGGRPEDDEVTALACDGKTLFAAYGKRNLIGLFDAASGALKGTWAVPGPGALAALGDGRVLAASQGRVLVAGDGRTAVFAADHLDQPAGLAVDAAGKVYASNRGKLQNVSVFDREGRFIASIGKPGGRPALGQYDPAGMLEPLGLAVDKSGRLWVMESIDSPKRVSVWNAATGRSAREFFGASAYSPYAYMDPEHPDEVYCHNVLWKVDLDKRTWRPHSTIWRDTAANMIQPPGPSGYAGHFRVLTAAGGRQFGWGMVDYSHMLYMRVGDVFKPIAGTIRVATGPFGRGILYPAMTVFHEKHKAPAYLWQDANDDQTVQPEELTVSPANRGEVTFNWIDRGLGVWCDAGFMFEPVRFAQDGRPIYDFSKTVPVPFKGDNSNETSLWLDEEEKAVYTLSLGADPHFARWTPDGRLQWKHGGLINWPNALSKPPQQPGEFWGPTMPLGIAGGLTGWASYFGTYHIYTTDGLAVGMVCVDGRKEMRLGPDVDACEVFGGQLVRPKGMNRYFLLHGDQDGRISEILGLDTIRRLAGGTYELTAADAELAARSLKQHEARKSAAQRLVIVRGREALSRAPVAEKIIDQNLAIRFQAAYDEKNLYIAAGVHSPAPLANRQADDRLVFKGGNLLDIQIACDPAADAARKKPAAGDVRILVSRRGDAPLAVVYRPVVKDARTEKIVLSSPTGSESFDRIERTDRISLDYRPQQGVQGFAAVVTIPLDLVGLQLRPGGKVKMDLGYIFGNAAGTQATLRSYLRNNGFSANVLNDVPNESRLEPHEWGQADIE